MLNAVTKVLVYDRSVLQCELLSASLACLRQGLEVKCLNDSESMMAMLATDEKWVVILSGKDDYGTCTSIVRRLRQRFPHLLMVLLLQEGRTDRVIEAVRLGARGIVYSNDNLAQLANCIDRVAEGEFSVGQLDAATILEGLSRPGGLITDVRGKALLSPREEEISRLVAEGMSNREVSHALKISESTVKNSLFHVFDKLGICNRVELARYVNASGDGE